MDSRQLYMATEHLTSIVSWEKDWIHFGTGKEINWGLVINSIKDYLDDENLNFVNTKENSRRAKINEITVVIENFLGQDDFQLWNSGLNRVIRFNKIGVLQIGRK